MSTQNANTILMIEPIAFGYNKETALNNHFQQKDKTNASSIQALAYQEFVEMTRLLRAKGIHVISIKDTAEPRTPDSIFPNNWVSFHKGERIALYPMFAKSRRLERRTDILYTINKMGFNFSEIANYVGYEQENHFLEGTGSMILDRENMLAYAAISQRTDKTVFQRFCTDFNYQPVIFSAFQTVRKQRFPIYHTNVLMSVADKYALVCLDTIADTTERQMIESTLRHTGKEIVEISMEQMLHFCGNMLQVQNQENTPFLVMSKSAHDSLDESQIETLKSYNELIVIPVPTIEKYGGGSVRCMMGEIF